MPGYHTDIFNTRLESQYLCKFCQLGLKDPWQKKTCGHRYCRECIDLIISFSTRLESRLCKACREETNQIEEIHIPISFGEVFEDRAAKRDMAKLHVKCKECGWRGIFRDYDEVHVKVCPKRPDNHYLPDRQNGQENRLRTSITKTFKDARNTRSYNPATSQTASRETSENRSSNACAPESYDNLRILLLEARVALNTMLISIKDDRLAQNERRLHELETTSYDGTFIWKITKFSQLSQDFVIDDRTTPLLSPSFYVGRSGYKMCLYLILTGDCSGKFHIHIMRGEFDAILAWPFRQQVNMLLLDQEGANDLMTTVEPRLNLLPSRRPMTEVNPALGCLEFTISNGLNGSTYFKEDTAYFKVVVGKESSQL